MVRHWTGEQQHETEPRENAEEVTMHNSGALGTLRQCGSADVLNCIYTWTALLRVAANRSLPWSLLQQSVFGEIGPTSRSSNHARQ